MTRAMKVSVRLTALMFQLCKPVYMTSSGGGLIASGKLSSPMTYTYVNGRASHCVLVNVALSLEGRKLTLSSRKTLSGSATLAH